MIYWIIAIIVCWILGGFASYKYMNENWSNSTFEKVWFSCVWPVLIPLYIIHYIHNHF